MKWIRAQSTYARWSSLFRSRRLVDEGNWKQKNTLNSRWWWSIAIVCYYDFTNACRLLKMICLDVFLRFPFSVSILEPLYGLNSNRLGFCSVRIIMVVLVFGWLSKTLYDYNMTLVRFLWSASGLWKFSHIAIDFKNISSSFQPILVKITIILSTLWSINRRRLFNVELKLIFHLLLLRLGYATPIDAVLWFDVFQSTRVYLRYKQHEVPEALKNALFIFPMHF